MTTNLDTLATALYVRTDDLLKESPQLAPWRPAIGITPRLNDAELVTLAVEIAIVEGMGHVNLGEPAQGEELYRRVLDSELSPVARTYVGSLLADSLIRQDARDEAIQAGFDVLNMLTDGVTSGRSLSQLRPVRVAAVQTKAEEFCARFDAAERSLTV